MMVPLRMLLMLFSWGALIALAILAVSFLFPRPSHSADRARRDPHALKVMEDRHPGGKTGQEQHRAPYRGIEK